MPWFLLPVLPFLRHLSLRPQLFPHVFPGTEANYTDDRKEGKQWKISEDTTERWVSKTVSHYKNGELDGPYEYTAHLHGKLYAYKSGSYKNGYKHGSWKEIDRDDIAVQGEYTEGRETGHWIRYDIISGEILNEWDR